MASVFERPAHGMQVITRGVPRLKKVWKEYFDIILSGKKKIEVRLADFEVNEGDTLILEEWDQATHEYTGRKIEVIATYIFKTKDQTFFTPEEVERYGFQIIQIEPKI